MSSLMWVGQQTEGVNHFLAAFQQRTKICSETLGYGLKSFALIRLVFPLQGVKCRTNRNSCVKLHKHSDT